MHVELVAWCRRHKLHVGLDKLDLALLSIASPSVDYPHFKGKGFQCKLLLARILYKWCCVLPWRCTCASLDIVQDFFRAVQAHS